MKITALRLEAFRSFTATAFDLNAPRVMITGLNEAGKTTIREAIRFLLTGKAQGLDGKGSGIEVLSPAFIGTSEVSVQGEVEGIGPLSRTWAPTGGGGLAVKRFTGNSPTQQMALYDTLKTCEAYLQAVLDSETFLNLHHADAKALILALLNVVVVINEGGNGKEYTLSELDAAYKKAYDERRAAKTVRVTIPPMPDGEYAPLDAIDARLKELAEDAQRLALRLGTSGERRRELQDRIDRLSRNVIAVPAVAEDLPVQIGELEEQLAVMEAAASSDDIDATMQSLPRNTDVVDVKDVAFLKGRAEALAQHKPANGCVLDPDVRCDTPKVNFSKRSKTLLAELDAVPMSVVPVPAVVKAPSRLTEVRHRLEGLKREQETYARAATAERARLDDIKALKEELSALEDTTAIEADILAVKDRIDKGQTIRAQAIRHAQALEAVATAQERAKAAAAEVERLEALVEMLGPNGARVAALAKALGPFTEAVNSLTGQFGWLVEFVLDPWSVVVNGRPVETYSKSERYRIGIAIQLAIASASGLSFAVVDELDILNAKNREAFGRLLYQSSLEQIIILGTRETDVPLPKMPNMVSYRLGKVDGKSGILERVA